MRRRDRPELRGPSAAPGHQAGPEQGQVSPGRHGPLTSPVAKAMKFSTVLGTVLPKSPMTTRPASSSPIRRSKNTLGEGGGRLGDQGSQTHLAGPTHPRKFKAPTPPRPKTSPGAGGRCPHPWLHPPGSLTTHPGCTPGWAELCPGRLPLQAPPTPALAPPGLAPPCPSRTPPAHPGPPAPRGLCPPEPFPIPPPAPPRPPPTLAVTLGPFLRSSAREAAGSRSRRAAPSAAAATST